MGIAQFSQNLPTDNLTQSLKSGVDLGLTCFSNLSHLEFSEAPQSSSGPRVRGLALPWNDVYNFGAGTLRIQEGAFDKTLSDIRGGNHDIVLAGDGAHQAYAFSLLGRTSVPEGQPGSMKLSVDQEGLWVDAVLPPTNFANDISQLMKAGVLKGLSIGIQSVPDFEEKRDSTGIHYLYKAVDLREVSVVPIPAMQNTTFDFADPPLPLSSEPQESPGISELVSEIVSQTILKLKEAEIEETILEESSDIELDSIADWIAQSRIEATEGGIT